MKSLRRNLNFPQKSKIWCIVGVVTVLALVLLVFLYFLKAGTTPYDDLPLSRYAKAHQTGPYMSYSSLEQVEADSDIIVEAVIGDVTGPAEAAFYSAEYCTVMPIGHTEKDLKVTKVYQGNISKGDILTLAESYYIWTDKDGTQTLVSDSYVKPLVRGETYLLFLRYSDTEKLYRPVADYMSIYAIPSKKQISKAMDTTLTQSDLPYLFQDCSATNWYPVYREVVEKYYMK